METLSSVLLTPEPHYIPGYTGYCPQLKFSMGKTYARHTAELLTCPELTRSAHMLLRTHAPAPSLRASADARHPNVIPGYTGFIPRSQNYFSCSFSNICDQALDEFHQDMEARNLRRSTQLPAIGNADQSERPKVPLVAISNKAVSSKPVRSITPITVSPYSMDNENQHKYFISGFTGHVPKSRFLIGKGFPIITNEALIMFGKQQSGEPSFSQDPVLRKDSSIPNIYRSKSGMMPSFTGHIPGQRFLFGHTFGRLSHEAVEKMHMERRLSQKP